MLSCVESRSRGDAWRCTVVHGNAQRARTTVVVVTGPRVHARLSVCARVCVCAVGCLRVHACDTARACACLFECVAVVLLPRKNSVKH